MDNKNNTKEEKLKELQELLDSLPPPEAWIVEMGEALASELLDNPVIKEALSRKDQ
jgi:hypothetical protein